MRQRRKTDIVSVVRVKLWADERPLLSKARLTKGTVSRLNERNYGPLQPSASLTGDG